MKFGIEDKLENVVFTESDPAEAGQGPENILDDDTLNIWKVIDSNVTLVLEFDEINADLIGLFNVTFETDLTVNIWDNYPTGSVIETKTITTTNGLYYQNAFMEIATTSNFKAIELIFSGSTSTFETQAGFIWVGDVIDLGCAEELQPFDESADDATVQRANGVDTNPRFPFQEFNLTTDKDVPFLTLRSNMRRLIDTGYTTKRPYLFDEPIYEGNPEIVLGILDAGRVGYDTFPISDTSSEYKAQVSIGIREVF